MNNLDLTFTPISSSSNFVLKIDEEPYHDKDDYDDNEEGPSSFVREPRKPLLPKNSGAVELEFEDNLLLLT